MFHALSYSADAVLFDALCLNRRLRFKIFLTLSPPPYIKAIPWFK